MRTTTRNVGEKRRIALAIVACVSTLAVTLSAAPAEAAAGRDWDCPPGYSCYYDNYDGRNKLFTAARCGTHDLRGGIYQNRINSVHNNNSSKGVYLDIWRNAGYWEEYDYVYPYEGRNVSSNDIDRIRIEC